MFGKTIETFQQTSATFGAKLYMCKPIRSCDGVTGLEYPMHPFFRSRIDINTWAVFNADLNEAFYSQAAPCQAAMLPFGMLPFVAVCAVCLLAVCRGDYVGKLHEVLAHYNKVLFHPMLIDAQVFERVRTKGDSYDREIKVSFLVARDGTHFRSFPRPVVGLSSGYTPSEAFMCSCLAKPLDYHLNTNPVVPERAPAQAPAFDTLHKLTPAMVARALKEFSVNRNTERAVRSHAAQLTLYNLPLDWVRFFEFRTDQMPTSALGTGTIPVPPTQVLLGSTAPERPIMVPTPQHPPMVPTPLPPAVVPQGYEIPMVDYPNQTKAIVAHVVPVGHAYQPIER
jgi:hypothetical protein